MSKGHGKLQRAILATMPADRPVDTFEIAGLAFDVAAIDGMVTIGASQRASVARALYSLERRGLVVKLFIGRKGRAYWGTASYAPRYAARVAAAFPDHPSGQQNQGTSAATTATTSAQPVSQMVT